MSRSYEQISALPAGITPLTGAELCELEQDGVSRKFPMSAMAGITAAHEAQHQRDGSDPIGSDDVEAYAIPYLDVNGRIDTRVSDASTTRAGKVTIASDGEVTALKVPAANDSRLSNARTPTSHGLNHTEYGADAIPSATTSNGGIMSAADKAKLDGFDYGVTADEKDALAGSYGTPSAENVFITETDPRIESITGVPVGLPVPVCDDAPALESPFEPMNGQLISDAESVFNGRRLRNMNGANVFLDLTFTADAGGAYAEIDESDSPAIGLHDWVIGTGIADNSWISDIGLPLPVATSQANIFRTSIELHEADLYTGSYTDVYKMDGSGVLQATSQTETGLCHLKSFDGGLYATKDIPSSNVYLMDGAGVFQTTAQVAKKYMNLFIHNDSLCVVVYNVGIYKMDEVGIFQPYLSITGIDSAESFNGLIIYQLSDVSDTPLYAHDGTKSFRYTVEAVPSDSKLRVIENRLFCFSTGGMFEVANGRIIQIIDLDTTYDAILVDDDLYVVALEGSSHDLYTIDYSKRLLTVSDPSASGAISCTFTNEGRGIVGGGFGSVGDQMQQITGSLTNVRGNSGTQAAAGAISSTDSGTSNYGATSGSAEFDLLFDSSGSPYARTSADAWGKTKTDAYKLTYYMRIK